MSIKEIEQVEGVPTDRVVRSFLTAMVPSSQTFNGAIAVEDEMYLSALTNAGGDPAQAAIRYYGNGLRIFQAVEQIANYYFGGWDEITNFLDFAGGYGRFTRFLANTIPSDRISVSDIYPEAVTFQTQQFQVNGIPSTLSPNEYKPGQTFHCILASSFFSHVPERNFTPWLKTLYNSLADGGLLIFSTHDVTLAPNPFALSESGIHFIPQSESRSLDSSVYGSTYVSEEFIQHSLNQVLGANATYYRIPKGLAEHQDLYLIAKNTTPDWSNFTFEHHPQGSLESIQLNSAGDWELKGRVSSLNANLSIQAIELRVNNKPIHRSLPRPGTDREWSWVCHLNHSQVSNEDIITINAINAGDLALERTIACQTLEELARCDRNTSKGTEKGVFVLAGMHRSGTSLTASLLNEVGVHLGDRLVGAKVGNDRGHFEDLDFVEFHQNVLRSQGLEIDGLTLAEQLAIATRYHKTAQQLLTEKSERSLWGWKDPRTTLFLDFWAALVPDAYFILVYRSPWEVVDSLYRRGSDEVVATYPEKAVELWMHYNRKMLEFYQANPDRCFLAHLDAIVSDPEGWIARIEEKWQLSLGTPTTNPIEPELLNREVSQSYRPAIIKACFPDAIAIYEELQTRAGTWKSHVEIDFETGLNALENYSSQDWAFTSWQEVGSASKSRKLLILKQKELEAQAEELRRTRSRYEESEYQKMLMQKKVQHHKSQFEQMQAECEQYKDTARRLRSQLEEAQYRLEDTQDRLNQSHAEAVQINKQLIDTSTELQQVHNLSGQIQTELNNQLQDLNSQVHHRNLELAAMKANKAWRLRMKWVQLKKSLGLIKE